MERSFAAAAEQAEKKRNESEKEESWRMRSATRAKILMRSVVSM